MTRIQVVGQPLAQDDIVEALGSAIITNAKEDTYPSRWVKAMPQPEELRAARFNLQWLEFARWGISPLLRQDRRVHRLRQLATPREVVGIFRLPVASADGQLAGIDVRDEPFYHAHPLWPGQQDNTWYSA